MNRVIQSTLYVEAIGYISRITAKASDQRKAGDQFATT